MNVSIIAEAGVNHNGRLDLALRLVDAAADAGADIVKFQTFRPHELATGNAAQAEYQARNSGQSQTQLNMLKDLELDLDAHCALLKRCGERGISFLSTPFDEPSVNLLVNGLGLDRVKIGSGDLTNAPLLLKIARASCKVILSTGMATLADIRDALGVLAFGYLGRENPDAAQFSIAFEDPEGRRKLREKVILLQCTSDYPAPDDEINLRAMQTIREAFGLPVGLSDHSVGIAIPISAVGCGAIMIEKHLTLDKTLPRPDHLASIEPDLFGKMVAGIRQVEKALGSGDKAPTPSERKTIAAARKSLVARMPIRQGENFTLENLAVKRPGIGLAPALLWSLLGKPAARDYRADEHIAESEIR